MVKFSIIIKGINIISKCSLLLENGLVITYIL